MPYTDRITSTVKYGTRMAQSNHASWWMPANGVSANMREKVSAPGRAAKSASGKCIGIRRKPPPRTKRYGGEIGPVASLMVSNLILPVEKPVPANGATYLAGNGSARNSDRHLVRRVGISPNTHVNIAHRVLDLIFRSSYH